MLRATGSLQGMPARAQSKLDSLLVAQQPRFARGSLVANRYSTAKTRGTANQALLAWPFRFGKPGWR